MWLHCHSACGMLRSMDMNIPSALQVQAWLSPMTNQQLQRLAEISEVPFTTLWKMRSGETTNPRIETVRKVYPHVAAVSDAAPAEKAAA